MRFELLPNEIVILCFEYLNTNEIFHSFDALNYRYDRLIRNIPLHLNFEHMTKSAYDQICQIMLSQPEIRNQIYSLRLSNIDDYDQISSFLSLFSLEQFPYLQSLCLICLYADNVWQLVWMLPMLSNLRHFSFSITSVGSDKLLAALPKSTLETLSLEVIEFNLLLTDQFLSVINLMISYCSIQKLYQLLRYVPQLKYLNVKRFHQFNEVEFEEKYLNDEYIAVHLKHFIIQFFGGIFNSLEIFLKKIPNLKSLIISSFTDDDESIIDAYRWERLITSSLPFLDVFKFRFEVNFLGKIDNIGNRFLPFQSYLWHQQHKWYIECAFSKYDLFIYTIPYLSNEYDLRSSIEIYPNTSNSNANWSDHITSLRLEPMSLTHTFEYYFSNVKSLKLYENPFENYTDFVLETKHIESFKMIINLNNLNHLCFSCSARTILPSMLFQLLQLAPNISSLKTDKRTLFHLTNNQLLSKHLNKTISKLDLTGILYPSILNIIEIEEISRKFSNIKQLCCDFDGSNKSLMLVKKMTKLPYLKVFIFRTNRPNYMHDWFKNHASELDICSFTIKYKPFRYFAFNVDDNDRGLELENDDHDIDLESNSD